MKRPLLACVALLVCSAAGTSQCAAELGKLLASDGVANDLFGGGVSLSGNTAAVTAPAHGHAGTDTGAVYVFVRAGSTWMEQAELVPSGVEPYDQFGAIAVAGEVLVTGAWRDDDMGVDSGAAYVFSRTGTTWNEQVKLVPSDLVSGDHFGYSVSASGTTIVVGAVGDNDGKVDAGSVYVFTESGGEWNQQAKLLASDAWHNDHFGDSLDLDGDTLVIGNRRESVYVFTRDGTAWSEEAKLMATDGEPGDAFGRAVSLHGDTLIVGAWNDDAGSAYAFARTGTLWTEEGKLVAAGLGSFAYFGTSVSLYGDAAVIGATRYQNFRGAAFLFVRQGSTWTEAAQIVPSDSAPDDVFGGAVALRGDTVLIGAVGDDDQGSRSGSVYVERLLAGPEFYCTAKVNSCGTLPAIAWTGQPSAGASTGFVVSASNARGDKLGLLLYTDAGRANVPFQGGVLCLGTPIRRAPLTSSGKGPATCDGVFSLDLNCFASGGCGGSPQPFLRVPGTTVDCQWWGRDTQAHGSFLSDGLEFVVCM